MRPHEPDRERQDGCKQDQVDHRADERRECDVAAGQQDESDDGEDADEEDAVEGLVGDRRDGHRQDPGGEQEEDDVDAPALP